MRRIAQRFVRDDAGAALVLALVMMFILGIMTAGVLLVGQANENSAYVSDQQREAFEIAQQGLAYAEGMLYYDSTHGIVVPTGTFPQPTQPIGSGTFSASLSVGSTYLTGTGTVGPYTRTVHASGTPALNVEVILDTSGSMTSACSGSVPGVASPEKIDCAKAGVRALLQGLWPCDATLGSCGLSATNGGSNLGANVANPVDEVGLIAFPALLSTASRPYEIDCNSSSTFGVTYPNATASGNSGYDIVGLSSDYRPSVGNTALNAFSNLVEAVNWGQCPGPAGSYSGGTSVLPSGTYYYNPSVAGSGSTTSTANTVTTTQAVTLTGLTFDPSGTSGLSYTATLGVVNGATWTSTGLTCTSSGGAPCTSSGSVSEPVGTKLNLKVVSSGSGSTRSATWTVSYTGPGGNYPGGNYYGLKVIGGQGSYLAGAIAQAQYDLDHSGRANVQNAIIVLSDGELNRPASFTDNTPCNTANNAATTAKADGIIIYSIAYNSALNCSDTGGPFLNTPGLTLMQSIATDATTFHNQPSAGDLTAIFTHIAGDLNGLRFIG